MAPTAQSEVTLPLITLMPLDRRAEPFDDPDWIFEAFLPIEAVLA